MIKNKNQVSKEWKLINMRHVDHLLGVEFLHDLYNRYEPKINSIRFRHTVVIWKDSVVKSYAPIDEWDSLGELVGDQYYCLDNSIIKNTKLLYSRDRRSFFDFINKVKKIKMYTLSNTELSSLLIRFQSVVLGELYVLNFVQIEHGLTLAIKKILSQILANQSTVDDIFVSIIQTEKVTASQAEKQMLYSIVLKWKFLKFFSLYKEKRAKEDVMKHFLKYRYLYSAYGEKPRVFNDFWANFNSYLYNKEKPPRFRIIQNILTKNSKTILRNLKNKKLHILVPLLVKGGIFRDTNKALLGQSIKYRFDILEEIANRKLESRSNLDYYLLSEVVDLLRNFKKLDAEEISSRKINGVVFKRSEDFSICVDENIIFNPAMVAYQKTLYGQCASPGVCIGICRIVFGKSDIKKVHKGDIMVAIGTDFDLIEAMYRAAGVITEEGGILSHASVVCRELNKPCCIGVKNATILLKDGQLIKVNAETGEVILLE
jgi:phosphohistidine swiveling domain-containing protein